MDSSILITLFIAILFFILGAAVIAIVSYLRNSARKSHRKVIAVTPDAPTLVEIARLLRDTQSQELVVQMDGKSFKSVDELSPVQQRRLSFTSNVLGKWLAKLVSESIQPAEEEPITELPSQPAETPVELSDWIPAETAPVEISSHHVPPFAMETTPEVKPVSTQLPDLVGEILNPAQTKEPVFKSIAMQINDILQERITGTPFEGRGITVSDAPDHGVVVTLDGQKYPGVKDVPDEEVRSLIRSAVMDWEKQGKAGPK